MKNNKFLRLFSLLISAVIVFSCFSMTAFADNSKTHIYELYQIFTGTFGSDGTLSNARWGQNGKQPESGEPADGRVSATVLNELTAASGTDTQKLAVITKYADLTGTPYRGEGAQPVKAADGPGYTYTGIEPGYYLIKDKDGSQTGEGSVYTLYVVKATGSKLTFEPKESVPVVSKKISDQGLTGANSASIGEEVNYVLTGSVPSRISDYATYYYKFTDTLSKGLTYKADSLRVILKNGDSEEDVTQYFYVNATQYHAESGTTITAAIADLKALGNVADSQYTVNGSTQVVVTYTAVLNENAVVKAPNSNDVKLTYSNNPNNSGTPSNDPPTPPVEDPIPPVPVGETVKSTVETYTTFLTITKTNQDGTRLQGAVFTLTGEGVKQALVTEQIFKQDPSGTYYKLKDGTYTTTAPQEGTTENYENPETKYLKESVTTLKGEGKSETTVQGTVDDTGVVTFTGLGAGTYTLTEITAPDGYNKIDPITFTITFDPETKAFSSSAPAITYAADNGGLHSTIINLPGSVLPHTGGIGTTIFYVTGSALALGAVVLFVVKKRMKHENG